MRSVGLVLVAVLCRSSPAADYLRDIKPVLKERCYACHGALKQEAGLRLDTAVAIRKGGENGKIVQPGNAAAGELLRRVSAKDETDRMPPEGQPLSQKEIAALRTWIDAGAKGPGNETPEADPRKHWAFQPPTRSPVPIVRGARIRNPIDAFLAQEQRARKLKPVGVVGKRLLLRRVFLDLTGLPPTRAQMLRFENDHRPDAYERVVDRLLGSPQYGERWGRHWMDIWRYTDWYGLNKQLRNSQKHIWRWRDWIIRSLNDDKGYDQMIREMLAGDEIAPTNPDVVAGTGFLARNYYLFNRTTWLDSTIEHTSKAFLGLTMNCAKCHDHKYDPLRQVDYYRMRAIFEPHQVRLDTIPGQTDLEKDGLPRAFDAHPNAKTFLHIRGNAKEPDKSRPIAAGVPQILEFAKWNPRPIQLPPTAHNPALRAFVLRDHLAIAEQKIIAARKALDQANRAAKSAKQPAGPRETKGTKFLTDDFSKADRNLWKIGPGKWSYRAGKLVQTQTGATRFFLRSVKNHPRDFELTIAFRITGGERWRSVGISFDVVDGREKLVYLSAVRPGSKAQIAYTIKGRSMYPAPAKQERPVKTGEPYEMTIRVRDRLVNVGIDGQHAIAYQLPIKREAGRLDITAFDAQVEYDRIAVRSLPSDAKLRSPGDSRAASPEIAHAEKQRAEKALAAAELYPAVLKAAHAADIAKSQSPKAKDTAERVRRAAQSARRYKLAIAEASLVAAEVKLLSATKKTRASLSVAVKKARQLVVARRAALAKPGTKYPSLSASLKAREGPDETAASRNAPFPKSSTGRRLAFATWVTHRKNPLTARVAVNHIWLRHFGRPLVESVTDFGRRAKRPTQHKLLDWLACELMESGWSMKRLHRLMVTSQTYRLSTSTAEADPATIAADRDNQYFWRRDPVRMESQVIRDSLLRLADALDLKMGGPTINPDLAGTVRRSLYFTHSRDAAHRFLKRFDDADILRCYRRAESVLPQQSLALANSKLAWSMASRLASRLHAKFKTDAEFIDAAFETILAMKPSAEEAAACREALSQTERLLRQNKHTSPQLQARVNIVHALFNHNNFITIR